jgi:hypothetical protein
VRRPFAPWRLRRHAERAYRVSELTDTVLLWKCPDNGRWCVVLTVSSVMVGCGTQLLNSDGRACSKTRATKGAMHDAVLPPKDAANGEPTGDKLLGIAAGVGEHEGSVAGREVVPRLQEKSVALGVQPGRPG